MILLIIMFFKPVVMLPRAAAAECTVNVGITLHYRLPIVSESLGGEGFASAAASDRRVLANPIFSSEFLSFCFVTVVGRLLR